MPHETRGRGIASLACELAAKVGFEAPSGASFLFIRRCGSLYYVEDAAAVAYAEFAVDVAHVVFRGALGDGEFFA